MRAVVACAVLVTLVAGCGGGHKALDAKGRKLPALGARCRTPVNAKIGWFHASDGILLDGASLGHGKTGVVLAHESPADLCGWVPYARVLSRAAFRVLLFDHRGSGLSQSPTENGQGRPLLARSRGCSRGAEAGRGSHRLPDGSFLRWGHERGCRVTPRLEDHRRRQRVRRNAPRGFPTSTHSRRCRSCECPFSSSALDRTAICRPPTHASWSVFRDRRTNVSCCFPEATTAGISSIARPTKRARAAS